MPDKDHPDLIPNIDFSKSVSCESGFPNPSPAAWDDRNGHGTHTTGTMVIDTQVAANKFTQGDLLEARLNQRHLTKLPDEGEPLGHR